MEGDLVIKVDPRGGVNSLITMSNPQYYPTCPHLGGVGYYIDTRNICEIKRNAINLKRRNRLASHDVNFYKAFIPGLNHQGSQIKLYTVKKGTEKGFPGLF